MNHYSMDRLEGVGGVAAKVADPHAHPTAGDDKARKIRENASAGSTAPGASPPGGRERMEPALRRAVTVDSAFQAAEAALGRMKQDLEAVVKNYPPYPPGSEERADLLKTYNGLRREIDRIAVDSPPPGGREDGSRPLESLAPADPHWVFTLDDRGMIRTVAREDAPEGVKVSASWPLPALPEESTDDDVRDVLHRVREALDEVQGKRARLWELLEPYGPADYYA